MNSNIAPPSKQQNQLNLQQSFSNIQTQCSDLLKNVSRTLNPLLNHNKTDASPKHPNIFSALESLRLQAKQAIDSGFSRFSSVSRSGNAPVWARISDDGAKTQVAAAAAPIGAGLSADDMEERLAGVPVYALSNSNEEFVLVSGTSTGKSLGLMFCKEEDAEALLKQMKAMDPRMRKEGSKVVALALSKVSWIQKSILSSLVLLFAEIRLLLLLLQVFQLKVNGVAFRLIPESTQVKNALKVKLICH
ncbi:unnamed protein product [Thlaspi arvense]|uniref:Protein TIC 22-like, chloroplastic n=1 Tax=Thlaspi arvense TaxID=13288 RepID=A0AAU9RZX7_THLAR|nr:unnamed protein product [Thlaspi arvense]